MNEIYHQPPVCIVPPDNPILRFYDILLPANDDLEPYLSTLYAHSIGNTIVDVIAGVPGSTSDITLFRQGQKDFKINQKFQGDKGYQGEPSIKTSMKKPKKRELTPDQKSKNKEMASSRIFVEHLIRILKIFRVASERFRLNSSKYEQIIMTICGESALREGFPLQATANPEGLVRLRIGALVLPL